MPFTEETSDAGYSRGTRTGPDEPIPRRKRRHGNSGSYKSKPKEEPVVEPTEDEREPDDGPLEEEPVPRVTTGQKVRWIGGKTYGGGRAGVGQTAASRRGPTRPPNYRLHVVAALSVTIIITFLAGGKDIISSVKGK